MLSFSLFFVIRCRLASRVTMWDWTYSFDIPTHITPSMLYKLYRGLSFCLLMPVVVNPMGFIFNYELAMTCLAFSLSVCLSQVQYD